MSSTGWRAALITNIPTPYRAPVFERLPRDAVKVFFCARSEPNRHWRVDALNFEHLFLRERMLRRADGFNFVHNNPDVWRALNEFKPDVVLTTGFSPTQLYAYTWSRVHKAKHVAMTDGTACSESKLGWPHRALRRIVYRDTAAFIAASRGGFELYRSYGIDEVHMFQSYLCADNTRYENLPRCSDRPFDVMFCGQLHERKLPFFFVDVCRAIVALRGECNALLVGAGPLRDPVISALKQSGVNVRHPGFADHSELPLLYSSAKTFLFTTRMDPWGVVANEALAAGTPVITTPFAGVAGELVIHGKTGYVLAPTDAGAWARAVANLVDSPETWVAFSQAAREVVRQYNYDNAAAAITLACDHAVSLKRSK